MNTVGGWMFLLRLGIRILNFSYPFICQDMSGRIYFLTPLLNNICLLIRSSDSRLDERFFSRAGLEETPAVTCATHGRRKGGSNDGVGSSAIRLKYSWMKWAKLFFKKTDLFVALTVAVCCLWSHPAVCFPLRQPCCFELRQISISSWMTFKKIAEVLLHTFPECKLKHIHF